MLPQIVDGRHLVMKLLERKLKRIVFVGAGRVVHPGGQTIVIFSDFESIAGQRVVDHFRRDQPQQYPRHAPASPGKPFPNVHKAFVELYQHIPPEHGKEGIGRFKAV